MQFCQCQQGYSEVRLPDNYITCKHVGSKSSMLLPLLLGLLLGLAGLAAAGVLMHRIVGLYLMGPHMKRSGPPGGWQTKTEEETNCSMWKESRIRKAALVVAILLRLSGSAECKCIPLLHAVEAYSAPRAHVVSRSHATATRISLPFANAARMCSGSKSELLAYLIACQEQSADCLLQGRASQLLWC